MSAQMPSGFHNAAADEDSYENDQRQMNQIEISEEQMLDIAEAILGAISRQLMEHKISVKQTFGGQDIIYNLEEFEGERNVQVMTADDFITRCYDIGVPELD